MGGVRVGAKGATFQMRSLARAEMATRDSCDNFAPKSCECAPNVASDTQRFQAHNGSNRAIMAANMQGTRPTIAIMGHVGVGNIGDEGIWSSRIWTRVFARRYR